MRIVRASADLVCTARPIDEIARRAGYGSTHAFARAFRDAYGVPPPRSTGARAATGPSIRYSEEEKTCSSMKSRSGGCPSCTAMRWHTPVRT
nr:helix-turn-helix domain-containing protein [Burkholderia sp. D-99]